MKKLGFTLIELLAVILILGIIALIAIPTVNNIIKESKKGAFKASTQNITSSVEQKCRMEQLKGETITKYYRFEDGVQLTDAGFKGESPTDGSIVVDDECNIDVVVNKENYIAVKKKDEDSVIIIEDRYYVPGTAVIYNPGDSNYTNWYVLKDHGDEVTLILNKNLDGPPQDSLEFMEPIVSRISTWSAEAKANARLLTVNDILELLGVNNWDNNLLYFETKTNVAPEVGIDRKYDWIISNIMDGDYPTGDLNLVTDYGYYIESDGSLRYKNSFDWVNEAWRMRAHFTRPVITVPKSSLQ